MALFPAPDPPSLLHLCSSCEMKFSRHLNISFLNLNPFFSHWLPCKLLFSRTGKHTILESGAFHISSPPFLLTQARSTLTSYPLPSVLIMLSVWIRKDLLDSGRLRLPCILLINDDHDNPLFY